MSGNGGGPSTSSSTHQSPQIIVPTPVPISVLSNNSAGAKDIFVLSHRLEVPPGEEIELCVKHSENDVNFFAAHIKRYSIYI